MTEAVDTLIIGGGSAGLATSYHLKQRGCPHLVLERAAQVAPAWRDGRWDSFTLVTPNSAFRMPGAPYAGEAPEQFMPRDAVVATFDAYVRRFDLPVRCQVEAESVGGDAADGRFRVATRTGEYDARCVVVATGLYQRPRRPPQAAGLPGSIAQVHSSSYRNPGTLKPGAVLVVGSGQSGCQIADELNRSGREVFLCVGGAGRAPRRYRGKDAFAWADLLGISDRTVDTLPSPKAKFAANPHMMGKPDVGGLNLHRLARDGITLLGRVKAIDADAIELEPDLHANLARADQFEAGLLAAIDLYVEQRGLDAEPGDLPQLRDGFALPVITRLELRHAGIGSVVWATGYDFDFDMVHFPVFDADGYPVQQRGVTARHGLYFVGLPWLHKQKSGLLSGVGEDAGFVADHIAADYIAADYIAAGR